MLESESFGFCVPIDFTASRPWRIQRTRKLDQSTRAYQDMLRSKKEPTTRRKRVIAMSAHPATCPKWISVSFRREIATALPITIGMKNRMAKIAYSRESGIVRRPTGFHDSPLGRVGSKK
jgi:hypothetical protein